MGSPGVCVNGIEQDRLGDEFFSLLARAFEEKKRLTTGSGKTLTRSL
jgi:hypothetical protein